MVEANYQSNEDFWIHYATINAIGDTSGFLNRIIPETERQLKERKQFEDDFLRCEDGELPEDITLAPMTAKYMQSILGNLKNGKIEGVFNIGESSPMYAVVSGDKTKMTAKLYVDRDDFNNVTEMRTDQKLDAVWNEILGKQVSYLNSVGLRVSSELTDQKNPKTVKVTSTEENIIISDI